MKENVKNIHLNPGLVNFVESEIFEKDFKKGFLFLTNRCFPLCQDFEKKSDLLQPQGNILFDLYSNLRPLYYVQLFTIIYKYTYYVRG